MHYNLKGSGPYILYGRVFSNLPIICMTPHKSSEVTKVKVEIDPSIFLISF